MAPPKTVKKKVDHIQAYWDLDALKVKNKELVYSNKKQQQEINAFRKQNLNLRQENISLIAENSNLKAILNRIQSTAEVALNDGVTQILHLCAIAKSVSNVKDTKTQAVSPHRVNGNLIQIPNITLSRLTGNSNHCLNNSRTTTNPHEDDSDDEVPSTSTGETDQFVQIRKRSQPNGFIENSISKSFDFEDEEDEDTLCASPNPRDISRSILNIQIERTNLSQEMDREHNNSNGQSTVNNIPFENFYPEHESEESQVSSDVDRLETIEEIEEPDSSNNCNRACDLNKELRICLDRLPNSTLNDEQITLLNDSTASSLIGEINNTLDERYRSDFQNTSYNGFRSYIPGNLFQHDLSRKSSSFTFTSHPEINVTKVIQENERSDPEAQIKLLRSLGLHPTISKDLLTSTPYKSDTINRSKELLTSTNLSNIINSNDNDGCSSSMLNMPNTSSSSNPTNSTRDSSVKDGSPVRRRQKRSVSSSDQDEGPVKIVRKTTRPKPEYTNITLRKTKQQSIEETLQTTEEISNLTEEDVETPKEQIRKKGAKPKSRIVVNVRYPRQNILSTTFRPSPKKRPARKAKPTTLIEPSINRKMRRS